MEPRAFEDVKDNGKKETGSWPERGIEQRFSLLIL